MKKIIISCLILGLFGLWQTKYIVFAETSGSSPESGVSSRIKTSYDWLVAKGANYGSTDAPDWDSATTYAWGTWWNRIMESAAWEPEGTAAAGNVLGGLTFYAGDGNRTTKTGTMTDRDGDNASSTQAAAGGVNYFTALAGFYDGDDRVSATDAQIAVLDGDLVAGNVKSGVSIFGVAGNYAAAAVDYSQQSLLNWDDYETGDETGEESTWTNTAGTATTGVWKDGRTGLYWSASQGSKTNIFPDQNHSTCSFFSTTPRGSYNGGDAVCGVAINACGILDLAAGGTSSTDWYLPSQKELQQAYIDGIYNQTNTTFVSTSLFWSSTEYSNTASYAWVVYLYFGLSSYSAKTDSIATRCVRRD